MSEYKNLDEIREEFVKSRSSMSKEQIDESIGFKNKKDKILSLFSIRYKPSRKLIDEGILVYTYIYKNSFYINGNSNYFRSYVLFSPDTKYEENPAFYSKIAAKLEDFLNSNNKKYNKLIRNLNSDVHEFKLDLLPIEIFEEKVFISTIYTKEKVNPNLRVGVNLCLLNRKVSKNIILLPEVFYSHQPQA